ncbi:MAG: CoA transferase [Gammaproteobacteria bacterium]|nr:CoA transferase [Gammaproteobacteria bacterium]
MKGIRVIDMTSVLSGPFCTWLLSTLGADVIKVENPAGDMARTSPPFEDDISLYFASLNRNKRSIVLDLKTEEGKEALHRLLKTADVFVENMRPGVRERLGCGEAELKRINPRLIQASISGFGQSGSLSDRPAYDIIVQAMSGMMSINGPQGGPPTRVGFSVGDIAAGLFATVGIMERLYRRDAQGKTESDVLDISMLACQWACLENAFARYLNAGIVPEPIGSGHPSMTPFEVYPTADADIIIALGSEKDWPRFCTALDLPELIEDPRYKSDAARIDNRDSMNLVLNEVLSKNTSAYWQQKLLAVSIPCTLLENIKSIADSNLSKEYRAFSTVKTASGREMRFVRNPIAAVDFVETAAPELGEHSAEILAEIGLLP